MKKNNEGGSVILLGFFTVLFAVITIFILVSSAGYLFGSAKDLKSMINNEGEPVKDEFVSLDVDLVFDWYAETEYKINGFIPAGTEKHCLVYMDDIGEQGAFISLTVKGKDDFKAIDKLIKENKGNRIIIVTTPGVVQSAIANALSLTPDNQHKMLIKTGSLTQISYFEGWSSVIYSDYTPL